MQRIGCLRMRRRRALYSNFRRGARKVDVELEGTRITFSVYTTENRFEEFIAMVRPGLFRARRHSGRTASNLGRVLLTCFALSAQAGTGKELLAPTGHLRVGVYAGSPTSMVVDPVSKQTHGVAYDLGQE